MNQQESVAYLLVLILIVAYSAPHIPSSPSDSIVNPFSCKQIQGSVVLKEQNEEGYKLYVELYIEEYDADGYIVWVSNNTYNSYEVGDSYEQITCDLFEYENIIQQFEDLQNVGILIPTS